MTDSDVDEDLSHEEHLDNEFLWNLLLLSQVSSFNAALYSMLLSFHPLRYPRVSGYESIFSSSTFLGMKPFINSP